MEELVRYLQVFLVGGGICLIGQVILNLTKISPARILLIFLLLGSFLELIGAFEVIKEFGGAGATVPICGFGANLVKGAIEKSQELGLLGAFLGGIETATAGLTAAIVFGFLISIIFNSRNKNA